MDADGGNRLDCYNRRRSPDLNVTVHDRDPQATDIEIQAFKNFLGEFEHDYAVELAKEPIPTIEDARSGDYAERESMR